MAISREEVLNVAELAKLELTDDEISAYVEQLNGILDYFNQLNTIDTSNVPPTASVLPLQNVLRPDDPAAPLPAEDVTANASEAEANQFRVSAVLDGSQ
jgi:aspartyl-tRNA(Asn)/glutamyl-tRNA(Gln) amidotransferase subunit C